MITLERARDLLQQAMQTKGPDFYYRLLNTSPHCSYVPMTGEKAAPLALDDPRRTIGCIVGVALDLAGEERHHEPKMWDVPVSRLQETYPDMMTGDAAHYFSAAQNAQDSCRSWGEAVAAAERSLWLLQRLYS